MYRLIPHNAQSASPFETVFRSFFGESGVAWGPAVDVFETEDAFVVRATPTPSPTTTQTGVDSTVFRVDRPQASYISYLRGGKITLVDSFEQRDTGATGGTARSKWMTEPDDRTHLPQDRRQGRAPGRAAHAEAP